MRGGMYVSEQNHKNSSRRTMQHHNMVFLYLSICSSPWKTLQLEEIVIKTTWWQIKLYDLYSVTSSKGFLDWIWNFLLHGLQSLSTIMLPGSSHCNICPIINLLVALFLMSRASRDHLNVIRSLPAEIKFSHTLNGSTRSFKAFLSLDPVTLCLKNTRVLQKWSNLS